MSKLKKIICCSMVRFGTNTPLKYTNTWLKFSFFFNQVFFSLDFRFFFFQSFNFFQSLKNILLFLGQVRHCHTPEVPQRRGGHHPHWCAEEVQRKAVEEVVWQGVLQQGEPAAGILQQASVYVRGREEELFYAGVSTWRI